MTFCIFFYFLSAPLAPNTVFDIGFVQGALHASSYGVRNCTRGGGGEPAVPTGAPALAQHPQPCNRGRTRTTVASALAVEVLAVCMTCRCYVSRFVSKDGLYYDS
jgi:hypothetical protein